MQYVAFLRGINVGGHSKVAMSELKDLFEKLEYSHVKTLLNSGNVVFETREVGAERIKNTIEEALSEKLGFSVKVVVRTLQDIQKLIASEPFKGIEVTPATRLYITFLATKAMSSLHIPYESKEKDYRILKVTETEVVSVLTVSEKRGTTEAMGILEKEFGKEITTRNWNTVVKVASQAGK